jgi:hypothetical protein
MTSMAVASASSCSAWAPGIRFFDQPILNTPYQTPDWHHARNDDGKPLGLQPDAGGRRGSKIIIPALDRPRNSVRIPMHRGHLLRFDRGQATDLIAATIPI